MATISGTVVSDSGEPLIGVNISVKGSTVGTITDIEGNYELEVPDEAATLIFSYTGYTTVDELDRNPNLEPQNPGY